MPTVHAADAGPGFEWSRFHIMSAPAVCRTVPAPLARAEREGREGVREGKKKEGTAVAAE